jgi:serine/threonine protein kinase
LKILYPYSPTFFQVNYDLTSRNKNTMIIPIKKGLWGLFNQPEPIIHRDLKPENILLDSNKKAVIGDLGCSKVFSSFQSVNQRRAIGTLVGSPPWMAPEILKAEAARIKNFEPIKSDIFSLGLIALFCLDIAEFQKQKNLNEDEVALQNYLDQFRLRFQKNNPGYMRFYYLLRCMVSFSAFSRPTLRQIYEDFESILKEGYKPPNPNPGPNPNLGPNPKRNPGEIMKFRVRKTCFYLINLKLKCIQNKFRER